MPVSRRQEASDSNNLPQLKEHQLNVLRAVMPEDPTSYWTEWPIYNRIWLRIKCGLSPTNSMNRLLHGIKEGKGKHLGLLQLGLLEQLDIDVDGVVVTFYRITKKGIKCLSLQSDAGHK